MCPHMQDLRLGRVGTHGRWPASSEPIWSLPVGGAGIPFADKYLARKP